MATYHRRSTMNPTRRKIPSSETRIACKTRPAGPSFSIPLQMDSITQSEADIRLTLVAVLAGDISVDVLTGGKLITQPPPNRVGGEALDLINLGEVFTAHREEKVAGDSRLQRESQFGPARWRPPDGSAHKTGARASQVQ